MAEIGRKRELKWVLPQVLSAEESLPIQIERHVRAHLQTIGALANFEMFELNLIRDYVVKCYEMCARAGLDDLQSYTLVNILFEVLSNNNASYGVVKSEKSLNDDFELLQKLIIEHPCLSRKQL